MDTDVSLWQPARAFLLLENGLALIPEPQWLGYGNLLYREETMPEGDEKTKREEPLLRPGMTPGEMNEILLGDQGSSYVGAHKLPSRRGPQPDDE